MKTRLGKLCAFIVLCGLLLPSASGVATPLTLQYTLTEEDTGGYRYDFTLVLDNHDGSWKEDSGWGWDYFVLGDRPDPEGEPSIPASSWSEPPLPPSDLLFMGGEHAGVGVYYESDEQKPYWERSAVGESLSWSVVGGENVSWSGVADVWRPQGTLYWSALNASGESNSGINYAVAEQQLDGEQNVIPEPSTVALVALSLLGMAGLSLLRRKANP